MLGFYSADTDQGRELTRMWDRFMMEVYIIMQPMRTPLPFVLHPVVAPKGMHVGTAKSMQKMLATGNFEAREGIGVKLRAQNTALGMGLQLCSATDQKKNKSSPTISSFKY